MNNNHDTTLSRSINQPPSIETVLPVRNISYSPNIQRSQRIARPISTATAVSSVDSHLHRTQSSGIASSRITKTTTNNRSSSNRNRSINTSSSISMSIPLSNDVNDDHCVDMVQNELPSDQSDDEMSIIDGIRQTVLSDDQSQPNLLNRAQVMNYFEVQENGFKCKLCSKVSFCRYHYVRCLFTRTRTQKDCSQLH